MLHTSETYSEDGDNNGLTSGDGYTGNNLKMRTVEGAGGCPGVAGGCSGGPVTHTNQNCDSTERVVGIFFLSKYIFCSIHRNFETIKDYKLLELNYFLNNNFFEYFFYFINLFN